MTVRSKFSLSEGGTWKQGSLCCFFFFYPGTDIASLNDLGDFHIIGIIIINVKCYGSTLRYQIRAVKCSFRRKVFFFFHSTVDSESHSFTGQELSDVFYLFVCF